LGTLNHTALTVDALRRAGCRILGVVMNRYIGDVAAADDQSMQHNRQWIEKLTGVKVLAVVPRVKPAGAMPHRGRLDPAVVDALGTLRWFDLMSTPR
jgi:dethiobiotin synthetase